MREFTASDVSDLLTQRIERVMAMAAREPDYEPTAGSVCFHLMELRRIMNGETTSGVYDDYGSKKL